MWRGILHHVVDSHEWLLVDEGGCAKCGHGDLPADRDKPWLERDSPAHIKLREVILDKRLLNTFDHYVNFR